MFQGISHYMTYLSTWKSKETRENTAVACGWWLLLWDPSLSLPHASISHVLRLWADHLDVVVLVSIRDVHSFPLSFFFLNCFGILYGEQYKANLITLIEATGSRVCEIWKSPNFLNILEANSTISINILHFFFFIFTSNEIQSSLLLWFDYETFPESSPQDKPIQFHSFCIKINGSLSTSIFWTIYVFLSLPSIPLNYLQNE